MEREFFRFVDKIIEIEMDFPVSYAINGIISYKGRKYLEWAMNKKDGGANNDVYVSKMNEVLTKLGITVKFD